MISRCIAPFKSAIPSKYTLSTMKGHLNDYSDLNWLFYLEQELK